ncbi:MAG: hypothetical protein NC428_01805 [Clostridium sp.]|nr:hypothetical protein [Clostridium sp.]
MASVNKIKELANAREYSLALEIVDSQDLSKSLNPQFLRLCGDIYSHASRYKDARRVLVMAHRLAPESKRVIFSLLELHLNMGHEELAKRYYDIYLFGSDDSVETKQAKYIYDNAHGEPAEKLIEYLEASYMHSMDYDWSFITYLLLIKLGRKSDAEALSDVYCATYKNSEHSDCIGKIAAGDLQVDSLIYTYAKEWIEDNDEDESEVRKQELKLIEDDELRIHPKEAEITIMFEEVGEGVEELSKRKMKKLIKEHEKQERELEEKERMANEEAETSGDEASNSDNKKTGLFKKLFKKSKPADEDLTEEIIVEQAGEEGKEKLEETEKVEETVKTEETEKAEETEKTEETEKAEAVEEIEETEKVEETAKMEETEKTEAVEEIEETEKIEEATKVEKTEKTEVSENSEPKSDEASDVEVVADTDSDTKAEAETETATSEIEATSETETVSETENNDNEKQTKKYKFNIEEVLLNDEPEQEDDSQLAEGYTDDDKFQDDWEQDTLDDGETDMSELHVKEKEARSDLLISVDEENDGFAAEADTIDDLEGEADYNDTSDNADSEKSETEKFFSKKKMEYVFEASDIIIDEDEDEEADDFSVIEDDEFGSMSVEDDEEIEAAAEVEEETQLVSEPDVEEETEIISEIDVEEKTELASEADVEEAEIISETDVEDEIELASEPDVEEEAEIISETDVEDEMEAAFETEIEEESQLVSETSVEEETEITSEADVEEDDFEFDFEFDSKTEPEKDESKENTAPAEDESVVEEDESIDLNEDADFEFDFEVKTEEKETHTEEAPLKSDEQQTFAVEETRLYSESDIQQEAERKEFETAYEAEIEPKVDETVYEAEVKQEVAETVYEAEVKQEEFETAYETKIEQKTDLLADIASKKSNLDFPVFKTDLFPEYHVVEVENNFDEIMEKAQDKLQANLLKEEQMQKEAEALLASLGIDYGSVTPKQQVEKAIHKPDNPINNTASRDALKASLKISSEKREILRKIKEHR